MAKSHTTLKSILTYGGVSKEEFAAAKPQISKTNLTTYKVVSCIVTVLSCVLLVFTLIFGREGFLPELNKFALPCGLMTVFSLIFMLIFLSAFTERGKNIEIATYVYNVGLAVILVYTGAFIETDFFVPYIPLIIFILLVAVFVLDKPYIIGILYSAIVVSFVPSILAYQGVKSSSVAGVISIIFFSIVGFALSAYIHYERIPPIIQKMKVEKERDTDALTGVENAIAYERKVSSINAKLYRDPNYQFAIAVFDINDLKITNDTYGHQQGDKLIISTAKIISKPFLSSKVYRIGGDEFVVILENIDFGEKDRIARELKETLLKLHKACNGGKDDVSVAFGIATYNKKIDRDFISLFSRADAEMYENKKELKALPKSKKKEG